MAGCGSYDYGYEAAGRRFYLVAHAYMSLYTRTARRLRDVFLGHLVLFLGTAGASSGGGCGAASALRNPFRVKVSR